MKLLTIKAEYLQVANYALYHNRIPICKSIEVTNTSKHSLTDVLISCAGEFISKYDSDVIPCINPGETIRISPFDVNLDSSRLASLTERITTHFTLTATGKKSPSQGTETIGEATCEIELMPYDHWSGTQILPQTIASFITPNHPAIASLVVDSAAILKEMTGSSALLEYQTGNSNDVRKQVTAAFAAVHNLGIVYRGMPASYEEVGQRVTLPAQVVSSKLGNCIELTLLILSFS